MDILLRFRTKNVITHKAIMYDIAMKTSFVAFPLAIYNDICEDRSQFCYELVNVVWLDWRKDLLEISKSYPDVVIETLDGFFVCFIRNGKSYRTPAVLKFPDRAFDESLLA